MSLAQRMKQAKLQKIAAEEEQARTAEAERTERARNTPALSTVFSAGDATPPAEATRAADSVAQRLRQGKLARQAIEQATSADFAPERSEGGAEATEYELLMAALGEDMRRLKSIQSTEGKIAAKREMIDRYSSHVDATLAAAIETGKAVQDELLVNIMIWRLDIGDYPVGLDIAEHVLRFGLRLPERYQRTPATLIAEEVAEAALTAFKADKDFVIVPLERAASLTADCDMPDVVRAKLLKAHGLCLQRIAEAAEKHPENYPAGAPLGARKVALADFRRALELDRKIGVVKDIERLEAWLKKHSPAPDAEQPQD